MAAQIVLAPLLDAPQVAADPQTHLIAFAALLEITNALASAGIAIALYPVLSRCAELAATGYLGLRIIEGAAGVVAAAVLAMIISRSADDIAFVLALHDTAFLMVLLVFSCGTLLLYPMLYAFRLVPPVLSLWGLIGGLLLLVSCVLILFGQIAVGGTADLILSLPIWINEMALALWFLVRGLDLSRVRPDDQHAA